MTLPRKGNYKKMSYGQKAIVWLQAQCGALSQKQRKVLLYILFVGYVLLTLWTLIEIF